MPSAWPKLLASGFSPAAPYSIILMYLQYDVMPVSVRLCKRAQPDMLVAHDVENGVTLLKRLRQHGKVTAHRVEAKAL